MPDPNADALRRAFPFGKAETVRPFSISENTTIEQMKHAFGTPKTDREKRTLAAFLEGIENSKPRAARASAMAGARRRKRYQKPSPGPAAKEETT